MHEPTVMPAVFIGHGSPMNTLEHNRYTQAWHDFGRAVPTPRAILAISAHWYINATAVTAMAAPEDHPRLLRFPRRAVRRPVPGTRRPGAGRRDRRAGQADVGRPRHRQLGPRSRHLVGAGAHVPEGRHPRRAAVDRCHQACRVPRAPRRCPRAAASSRRAGRRQRQRRAQPAVGSTGATRRAPSSGPASSTKPPGPSCPSGPGDIAELTRHRHYELAAPTPDHLLPLFYIAGHGSRCRHHHRVLLGGYAMGSLSMTSYVLDGGSASSA